MICWIKSPLILEGFSQVSLDTLHSAKGSAMPKKLRAKFANGVLTPLEHVNLPEGAVVTVSIKDEPQLSPEERAKILKSTAGAWADNSEYWENFKRTLRSPRLSTNEWLEKVRKRKEASQTRITADEILEARDADRK